MPLVPSQNEHDNLSQRVDVLAQDVATLAMRVHVLENIPEHPPDPDPDPDPPPAAHVWRPPNTAQDGYQVFPRDVGVEAYAPRFEATFPSPVTGWVYVSEQHHTTVARTVNVGLVSVVLEPGRMERIPFSGSSVTITTDASSSDRNVPLFAIESDVPVSSVTGHPLEQLPPPPGPEPPDQTVVEFADPPATFDNDKLYRPRFPDRIYQGFDLRGTDLVTLQGVKVSGAHSSSRYNGAILPGRNTTLLEAEVFESGRLGVELTAGADGVRIINSKFLNNALNAVWAHAYHRNFPTDQHPHSVEITGCTFRNNNTRNEALNWDAGDVKLLHSINARVADNQFLGSFGEAVWYDSDAQGIIENNLIRDYARAIHVEMCWQDLGETHVLNNEIDNCSNDPRGWVWHAAILISGSTGVTVRGNTITGSVKGKDISELGFDHSVRSPHHSSDRVHAQYGETHVEWTGHNTIDQPDTVLWRGGYPTWHLAGTSTYNVKDLIDR